MAGENNSASVLRSPLLLGMIALLVLLAAGVGANLFFMSGGPTGGSGYVKHGAELKGLSQSIAKHAAMAADGTRASFDALETDKAAFTRHLSTLQSGDAVLGTVPASSKGAIKQVASWWAQLTPRMDQVLAGKSAIANLKEMGADVNINLQLIQQDNNKIVRALVRADAAANEIVTAQRQALIVERIAHVIDKIIDRGGDQALQDQFTRDSQTFRAVLRGFKNGDVNLRMAKVTDPDVIENLNRIEGLFKSVGVSAQTIALQSNQISKMRNAVAALDGASAEIKPVLASLIESLAANDSSDAMGSKEMGLGLLGGMLLIFFVIAFLISRASDSSVTKTTQQNEENQAAILQLLDELADLADGDLRVQATVTESFTGAIADSINFSIDQMRALVAKINETSGKVSSAADQTQSSVSALSQASQRQAAEIADVSEAVNEMAVSIDMVSYNAAESSSVAERSVDIASKGAVVVQNTIDGMDSIRGQIQETAKRIKRLGESSQEIGDIVALINDIADQTNILSLNAAIQASMAGDAGKGFAVVADEVQRLAERSGAAAKQISALVKTIQSDTNEAVSSMEQTTAEVVQGTKLAEDAGVALGEIEGVSKSLAEIIENISDAARQQAASAGKISNTMKSIQEITTATTDGTKVAATAVGNLAEMTDELRSSVTGFKLPG
ncbi:MAG: twitching motility protein PilJ [Candidatus Azotimanducaceae bacterium]|jgi:twitching motility protein PilJ